MHGYIAPAFDWKNPDYAAVWNARRDRLMRLRADPALLKEVKAYYAEAPHQFISDWGVTIDPRVARLGRNPVFPLVLFPKQVELIHWIDERYRTGTPGIMDKSRDVGASWVAGAYTCHQCLFARDLTFGFGSYVEDKIDRSGDPDSLFYKLRMFLTNLPREFRGDWDVKKNSAHMRLQFPETGCSITGEAGDNIGRGGRKTIYFVDEAAHLERPELVDASLSANTDTRIDMSSVNGMANPFAIKRHSGLIPAFTFHWRDDPRKDDAWYAKKSAELDPITLAQEIDLNYAASAEGVIIPSAWIQAAVDAHVKLKIEPTGARRAALDVADEGRDKNAAAFTHGQLLTHVESWSGVGLDIYQTTAKMMLLCDDRRYSEFEYDGDGLGAGVRGDARVLNEARVKDKGKPCRASMFRGSAAVLWPEQFARGPDGKPLERRNKDYFKNLKAQAWFALRYRFQQTFRALNGMPFDPDDLISIGDFPERAKLLVELAQPVYLLDNSGKILVDKVPDGVASPNLADAVMMAFAPRQQGLRISDGALNGQAKPLRPIPGAHAHQYQGPYRGA